MLVQNSMANQEKVVYSGLESSGPSLKFPYFVQAIPNTNKTNRSIIIRYAHAKFSVIPENKIFEKALNCLLKQIAKNVSPNDIISEKINTELYVFLFLHIYLLSPNSLFILLSIYNNYIFFKYFIKFCLFSKAVVVGLPRSSLVPIEHFTSIKDKALHFFAASSSASRSSKLSIDKRINKEFGDKR